MQKISIITVNFNNSAGLEKTMYSVCSQNYPNLEYIVIDGDSTDGSKETILRFRDKISYWVSEPDQGIYDAMNKAILHATGDYVLFLNSGDFFCASVLPEVFSELQTEDLLVGRQRFVQNGRKIGISPRLHISEINMEYFLSSTLPHQATFIKRGLFDRCGLYDMSYRICADWVFWIEAIVKNHCTVKMLDCPVSFMDNGGVSSDMEKCHRDMSRYLQVCLNEKFLTWDVILENAQKARMHDLCTRSKTLYFCNKVLAWVGKKI